MSASPALSQAAPLPPSAQGQHPTAALVMGRPEAAAQVWCDAPEGASSPAKARGRRGPGLVKALVGAVAATLLALLGHPVLAGVAGGIATLHAVAAVFSPGRLQPLLGRLEARLAGLIAQGVTWALMAPFFFLVFAPFRLLFRRGARNSLSPLLEPRAPTYWQSREAQADTTCSERPF